LRQFLVSMTVGEKAEVAHFVQALGQDMEDESAQEFRGVQGLGSQLAGSLVVLEAERHLAVLQSHQAVVGNRYAIHIARQVFQDLRRLTRFFGIDHSLLVAQRLEQPPPGRGLGQLPAPTRQGELALAIEVLEPVEVELAEAPEQHPHGQAEVGPTRPPPGAIGSQSPGR
jgi:hypothetical protein